MSIATKRVVSAAISGAQSTRKSSHMVINVIRYIGISLYRSIHAYVCINTFFLDMYIYIFTHT
jgi:hypothetical protein